MTKEQEVIAENFINDLKNAHGQINYNDAPAFVGVGSTTRGIIIKALRELHIIEDYTSGTAHMRLREYGWRFPGFEAQRQLEREENERRLTKETLEREQIQSVIDTNKMQKKVLWITIGVSALTLATQAWDMYNKQPIIVQPSQLEIPNLKVDKDSISLRIYKVDSLP